MGGHTDSQVESQAHASRKKWWILRIYSWLSIKLCRLALGGQTVKRLRRLAYEFELDQSQRKSRPVERKSKTSIDLRQHVSPFGQGITRFIPI